MTCTCPRCKSSYELYRRSDYRWDMDTKTWGPMEPGYDVECTACDWQGSLEDVEHPDGADAAGE